MTGPRKKRLLIIEDDSDIQILLKQLFEIEGYDLELANNGRDGFLKLQTSSVLPDLILLDLMMPVMDGYEFRSKQRSDERLAGIPVVVMTARGAPNHLDKATLAASDYLKKPVELDDLLSVVQKHCG